MEILLCLFELKVEYLQTRKTENGRPNRNATKASGTMFIILIVFLVAWLPTSLLDIVFQVLDSLIVSLSSLNRWTIEVDPIFDPIFDLYLILYLILFPKVYANEHYRHMRYYIVTHSTQICMAMGWELQPSLGLLVFLNNLHYLPSALNPILYAARQKHIRHEVGTWVMAVWKRRAIIIYPYRPAEFLPHSFQPCSHTIRDPGLPRFY